MEPPFPRDTLPELDEVGGQTLILGDFGQGIYQSFVFFVTTSVAHEWLNNKSSLLLLLLLCKLAGRVQQPVLQHEVFSLRTFVKSLVVLLDHLYLQSKLLRSIAVIKLKFVQHFFGF